ncbi:type IV pilus modification protein PilV [Dokdonella sp.]|uniref:type IV pilus modification protein PilV n=1 Tax=Dokdonella sp. TaxID=2291710 RepID=UPI0031BDBED4|nr:type IV pilus modification protein PilV [Dokdonella sp.]
MQPVNRARGFTLLEVLIAILVFSMGLLGAASLMVLSVRTNHSAYLRTQASFLAEGMADRIRTNLGWAEDYNGDYDSGTAGAGTCPSNVCSPADLVTRDTEIWSQQLVDFLPAATASINCAGSGASPAHRGTQPFNGLCTIIINWTEADLSRTAGTPATQTFAWVFQP